MSNPSLIKKITLSFAVLLLLHSCTVQKNTGTEDQWYAFIKSSSEIQDPAKIYDFSDGMIRMHGNNIGYLMSKKSYGAFVMTLDYRWNMDAQYATKGKKNSGVMYNIPAGSPDKIWPKGIQFQIKENTTGDFIFMDQISATVNGKTVEPGASVSSPKFSDHEKPYGEWNTIRIESDHGHIQQYLNGILVNECTQASAAEGKISLNYEGSAIDFRNIEIKNGAK